MRKPLDKKSMPCNKPRKSPNPNKKRVVKACANGKEKIIHFGATGYGHNYSPGARKSFKARHNCSSATNKLSARYWACKNLWAGPGGSKASCPKNRKCKK
jgi:hypothetical protein